MEQNIAAKTARFEQSFRERERNGDCHAIFMRGCCYHFALTLSKLYGYKLAYLPSQSYEDSDVPGIIRIAHCWARKENGMAIDINGVLPEDVLITIFDPTNTSQPLEISVEQVRNSLNARKPLAKLNDEIFALAEKIICTHERFHDARPPRNIWTSFSE